MGSIIKIVGNSKIHSKFTINKGEILNKPDSIILESESGYMTQEISGQIILEDQNQPQQQ